MNNEVRLLIGLPGAGKSTYANQLLKSDPTFVKVCRDDFRFAFKNTYSVDEDTESLVSAAVDACINKALDKGYNVVVDETHCSSKHLRGQIEKFGKKARIVLKIIGAELSMKEIYAQDASRSLDKKVGETIIDGMHKGFKHIVQNKKEYQERINELAGEVVTGITSFKQNPALPKAIIVDIDGTVAHMGKHRGPFDWDKVDQDEPDVQILNLLYPLEQKYDVIFLSGRDESCRAKTEEWLNAYYGIPYAALYMREKGNMEKDAIVKERIFLNEIAPKYFVEAVFDDRDQVVAMWRNKLGLKCLQVAYGNF